MTSHLTPPTSPLPPNTSHLPPSTFFFERGCRVIPGGVNSPVRAFRSVGGTPVYMASAQGASLTTADGQNLVDFCGSWGPLILGHAHPEVVEAVQRAAANGMSFGACAPAEVEFAELLCELVPSMEKVRLVNSGTEAVMSAIRLARGFTGRNKILKFDGCYHGHADYLLVSAGSGLLTGGITSSAGVTPQAAAEVLVASYNDTEAVRMAVEAHGTDLAAIIVEPIAGNMGLVMPDPGFLQALRDTATACGALLIFDEVITGFRLAPTTYGVLCGIKPDLTCIGKIIGGGLPIGAFGGRADVMDKLAPLGPVYQAGTLSGNPVALAAGLATLRLLRQDPPYERIERMARRLAEGLHSLASQLGIPFHPAQTGSMLTPFFRSGPPRNLAEAKTSDTRAYGRFFHGMLDRGFYLPPAQFELSFVFVLGVREEHRGGEKARWWRASDANTTLTKGGANGRRNRTDRKKATRRE
ncbi:MAG: glutamate-1-semialdehyde-2,1-aminomutase [Lentisphaerae bacterium]|nr:glutamate-1-semialdehyde-2,1-aminomutase [Lentisphaerota bacterium]